MRRVRGPQAGAISHAVAFQPSIFSDIWYARAVAFLTVMCFYLFVSALY